MVDNKTLAQHEIDRLAESVFAAADDKDRIAESQAKKLDITASFIRSKLAIQ